MKLTITKRFQFDAAHRLLGYDGLCGSIHGHRYVVETTFSGEQDELGMIADFAKLKRVIGEWIKRNWDHALLLHRDDPTPVMPGQRVAMLDRNPTAENLARELAQAIMGMYLGAGVEWERVRVYETPDAYAEVLR